MKKIILSLLVIIVGIAIYAYLNIGFIVKKAVHKYGSEITGTSVALEGFDLELTKGKASASNLTVANPSGYQAKNIFELKDISVDIDINSLMSKEVIIESIVVNQPIITFEAISLQQNNIKALQENVNNNLPQTQKTESISTAQEKPAKNILIKRFVLSGATVQVLLPNIPEQTLELPEIVITDFDGNLQKQIAKVLDSIISTTTKSVSNVAREGLESVAKDNLNKITDSIKDKIDLKGLF